MKRYDVENSLIKRRFDGKRFFATKKLPVIPKSIDDIIYITNETDYLDTLAYKFYKDTTLWWIIALANNLGNGRLSVEGGKQLRIPSRPAEIVKNFNDINK